MTRLARALAAVVEKAGGREAFTGKPRDGRVTPGDMSNFLSGKKPPGLVTILRICAIAEGTPAEPLLGELVEAWEEARVVEVQKDVASVRSAARLAAPHRILWFNGSTSQAKISAGARLTELLGYLTDDHAAEFAAHLRAFRMAAEEKAWAPVRFYLDEAAEVARKAAAFRKMPLPTSPPPSSRERTGE